VALDIARMLLLPVDTLRQTDISEEALDILSKSRVRHVHLVGRRGPLQVGRLLQEILQ
jgi:adrenodoxin-NADP+ reductase